MNLTQRDITALSVIEPLLESMSDEGREAAIELIERTLQKSKTPRIDLLKRQVRAYENEARRARGETVYDDNPIYCGDLDRPQVHAVFLSEPEKTDAYRQNDVG